MKLFIFFIFFSTFLFPQPYISTKDNLKEANKRKLSEIKAYNKYEYKYSFGKRKTNGVKLEEAEFDNLGFLIKAKYYESDRLSTYIENEYNEENNLISHSEIDLFKDIMLRDLNRFNSSGLNLECITFNSRGNIEFKQFFEYNSNSQNIGGKTIYANGDLYSKWKHRYEKNNLIEEILYSSDGNVSLKIVSKYSKNKKVKETRYQEDGSKSMEIAFEYPSKNKCVIKTSHYVLAEPIITNVTKITDNKERIIEEYLTKDDDSINWRIKYTYDINGNPLEEIHFNSLDEPERVEVYEYSYY